MQFAHPNCLWLLTLVPALALLLVWAFRARRRALEQFVSQPLSDRLAQSVRPVVRRWKAVLLVAGVLLSVLALAQPRWGFEWRQVKSKGVDVFVLLDVSKSMWTEDVRPNRLTQAKFAVEDLLGKLQGDRIGLIAFAGSAFIQCPLTIDYEAFRLALHDADPHIIPRGGTAIALAIRTALKGFETGVDRDRAIVLVSDGEETVPDALAAADEAAKEGVRIYTIGVGTTEGDLIPIREDGHPMEYVKDPDGAVVKSRLDETLLKQLALKTQGIYVRSVAGDFGMDTVYDKGIAQLKHKEVSEKLQRRFYERFQWPLGLALLLLAIEMFLSDRRRSVTRSVALLVALVGFAGSTQAAESPPEIYNQGVYGYQTNDYQSAVQDFEQATAAKDRNLQERALYNLGNTFYRMGQATESQSLDKAMPIYQRSLKSYEDTLGLNPQDPDAKFNRDVVKKKIEELKKKQEQQKQQQQQQQGNQQKDQQQGQSGQQQQQQQGGQQKQDQQKQDQQQSGQAQNQPPPEQPSKSPEQQQKDQQQQARQQQSQQQQKNDQQQKQDQGQGQSPKPDDQQSPGEAQPGDEGNFDKQRAAALLDNLREDERNWNFFPELQMKDSKDTNAPVKDW
jgi:Ca-activated chloride channel family protein